MKLYRLLTLTILLLPLAAPRLVAQEKVTLEEPKAPDILAELENSPDGVLRVRLTDGGVFKSLVVKATVPIEDVLGPQKGKALARKEAEIQCKRALATFFKEQCVFTQSSNNTLTIQSKNESSKDAAGNKVKIGSSQSQESKVLTDTSDAVAHRAISGLMTVHTSVDQKGETFTLVMALTQKSLNSARIVADALDGRSPVLNGRGDGARDDREPNNAETKTNRDVLDDLR